MLKSGRGYLQARVRRAGDVDAIPLPLKTKGGVPDATTEKVAEAPMVTDCGCGWVLMAGAVGAGLETVRTAALEIALATGFETNTA